MGYRYWICGRSCGRASEPALTPSSKRRTDPFSGLLVEGLLAYSLKRYPAMYTQFSRGAVIGTVLLLVAVVLPYQAQAQAETQSYPIAEAKAAYWEVAANAEELIARAWDAWAQAGGECGEEGGTETCREWAAENRQNAEEYRIPAKHIKENPSPVQRT